jgi:hypothetical protein
MKYNLELRKSDKIRIELGTQEIRKRNIFPKVILYHS